MTQGQKPAVAAGAIILFFFSGAAALVYEVLWMKELSLLFGNSAQAAAATLAAFFAGIAAGNAYWGRRSAEIARPLRAYGLLELGVAASAVFYFGVLRAYDSIYGALFGLFEGTPVSFMLIKFLLSFLLFFPSAFFMGGTLPIMAQFLVRQKRLLGGAPRRFMRSTRLAQQAALSPPGLFCLKRWDLKRPISLRWPRHCSSRRRPFC